MRFRKLHLQSYKSTCRIGFHCSVQVNCQVPGPVWLTCSTFRSMTTTSLVSIFSPIEKGLFTFHSSPYTYYTKVECQSLMSHNFFRPAPGGMVCVVQLVHHAFEFKCSDRYMCHISQIYTNLMLKSQLKT